MRDSTDASAPQSAITSQQRSASRSLDDRGIEVVLEEGALHRRAEGEGAQHEHGALALTQVLGTVLARAVAVTEQAEHVVAHLERHAERVAVLSHGAAAPASPAKARPSWSGRVTV